MRRILRRSFPLLVVAGLVAVPASVPAIAESDDATSITHRQSVRTELSPSGGVDESLVFTQLLVAGDGPVEVVLPNQSTTGLRHISGFGGPGIEGDDVVWSVDATSEGAFRRAVADNTAPLPVEFDIAYELDGQTLDPEDVVGRSGRLTVTYTVRNVTAEPTEVTFTDGKGASQTATVDVAVPMVGTLALDLDGRFSAIDAPLAAVVGDGRGNTVVSWSMVLFSPIGDEEQTVSYTADVVDAVVPRARSQIVPVSSESFASLATTEEAYRGAVSSTRELTSGALTLDGSVGLLAAGSGQLLDGLLQLRDGAEQLNDGLGGTAAPGARELSEGMSRARAGGRELGDGLGELRSGATRLSEGMNQARDGGATLDAGLNELRSGATRLSNGLDDARDGGARLNAGLGDLAAGGDELSAGAGELAAGASQLDASAGMLAGGAGQLATGAAGLLAGLQQFQAGINAPDGLPAAIAGVAQLSGGVANLIDGIGDADTPGQTILFGITQLRAGLEDVSDGAALIASGATQLEVGLGTIPDCNPDTHLDGDPATTTPCGVKDFVDWVATDGGNHGMIPAPYAGVLGGVSSNIDGPILGGLEQIRLGALAIQVGIDETGDLSEATLLNGLRLLQFGVSNPAAFTAPPPAANPGCLRPGDPGHQPEMLPCGLLQGLQLIGGGLAQLDGGLGGALGGINVALGSTADAPTASLLGAASAVAGGSATVAGGAQQLRQQGTAPLAAGAGQLAAGAQQLGAGAGLAAGGSGDLLDGLRQLASGGGDLAAGAGRAAGGSGDLLDGLRQLASGGGDLAAGAGRAATGANELAAGLVLLDDGALRLADGLVDAADGSDQLAEGLGSAVGGGEQIAGGAQRLQAEGTSALVEAVSGASGDSSLLLETVLAADARGLAGDGLPYGTADDAVASAVFQYEIAGVGGPDESPSLVVRILFTVLAFAAAGGLLYALRLRLG